MNIDTENTKTRGGRRRRVVVVLGMHNSGTSLLAQVIEALGFRLGDNLLNLKSEINLGKYDYFEHRDIQAVQEQLLRRLDRHWQTPKGALPMPEGWWLDPEIEPYRNRLLQIVEREIEAAPSLWAFKDPRTARLLPLWRDVFEELGVEPLYLVTIRSPAVVGRSFASKAQVPASYAELLWIQHYVDAVAFSRPENRHIIDYDRWFDDGMMELTALAHFLDIPEERVAEAAPRVLGFVDPGLRAFKKAGPARLAIADEFYEALRASARTASPDDFAAVRDRMTSAISLLAAWAEGVEGPRAGTGEERAPLWISRFAPVARDRVPTTEQDFPRLFAQASLPARSLDVCFATMEILGPVRNAGLGKAVTALAELLAVAGHRVTVLYLGPERHDKAAFQHWVETYRQQGIALVPLPSASRPVAGSWPVAEAWETYEWLKDRAFDVVHLHDWVGHGYFVTLAKRLGLGFANSVLCVTAYGPSGWCAEGNGRVPENAAELEIDVLERGTVERADLLVSGSAYLARWMIGQGWLLPSQVYVHPTVVPGERSILTAPQRQEGGAVRELVFFGRLEPRKGIALFCDAIDQLQDGAFADIAIRFLGRPTFIEGEPAEAYLARRATRWQQDWSLISDRDTAGALAYLCEPGRLAVIPSRIDNAPHTVIECLEAGIPFIATATGGTPELIHPADRASVLFEYDSAALVAKLRAVCAEGAASARPATIPQETNEAWLAWHRHLPASTAEIPEEAAGPAVSVVAMQPSAHAHAINASVQATSEPFVLLAGAGTSIGPEGLERLSVLIGTLDADLLLLAVSDMARLRPALDWTPALGLMGAVPTAGLLIRKSVFIALGGCRDVADPLGDLLQRAFYGGRSILPLPFIEMEALALPVPAGLDAALAPPVLRDVLLAASIQRRDAERRVANLEAERAELTARHHRLEADFAQASASLQALEGELAGELNSLRASRSWRMIQRVQKTLFGIEASSAPDTRNPVELRHHIGAIRTSTLWELSGLFRGMLRLARRCWHRS